MICAEMFQYVVSRLSNLHISIAIHILLAHS
jgi:hypothetical protein